MEIEKIIEDKLNQNTDYKELVMLVSLHISELINKSFMQFIQLMYRLDIDEKHFYESDVLDTNNLAEIIIQREIQKMEFKKKFKRSENIDEEESW